MLICILQRFMKLQVINNLSRQPLPYINNAGYAIKAFVNPEGYLYIDSNGSAFNGMTVAANVRYTKK